MKNILFIYSLMLLTTMGCTNDDELYRSIGKEPAKEDSTLPNENIETDIFNAINLDYPGLEQVKSWHETGNYYSAVKALLNYYNGRTGIINPNVALIIPNITADQRLFADYATNNYRFYVNYNYFEDSSKKQPWSLLNPDNTINWTFKPENADNEYQKQLHRHSWMPFQGKAYRITNDEKYIKSWKTVYTDWIKQNPKPATPNTTTWWQLQVSTRIMGQTELFEYFKISPSFTPEWLSFFSTHFAEHADYLMAHRYEEENNILLSQGIALVFAGTLFPEFKNAKQWQETGCNILNEQIQKQFLKDGMLSDLSLHYHIGILKDLYSLRRLSQLNHIPSNLFSPEFDSTIEKAAELVMYFTYPNYFTAASNDYCTSAFNDSWMQTKDPLKNNFIKYTEMFPDNQELRFMSTLGAKGKSPSTQMKAFNFSGHYILRNGWEKSSTMLIHSNNYTNDKMEIWSHKQPDNGTFELYHNGRNFFPDSGVCSYVGDDNANQTRNWFRQTIAHNTLTLNDQNITAAQGKLIKAKDGETELIVTENQGYTNFKHRRSIFFVEKKFFVLVDEGIGAATGTANLYFHLCEKDSPVILENSNFGAHTNFEDGNNLLMRSFGNSPIIFRPFDGRVAYKTDGTYETRKSYALDMQKTSNVPVRYITVLLPVNEANVHNINAEFIDQENNLTRGVAIKVTIDQQEYTLTYTL